MNTFSNARNFAVEKVFSLLGKEVLHFGILILNIWISFLFVFSVLCGE